MKRSFRKIAEKICMGLMFLGVIGTAHPELIGRVPSVETVPSVSSFNRILLRHPFVVAFFCRGAEYHKSDAVFRAISNNPGYRQAGVGFATIDISKTRLDPLMGSYGVTDVPAVIIFENSLQVNDNDGNPALLQGLFTEVEVRSLIDRTIGSDLQDAIKQAKKEQRRNAEARATTVVPYPGFGWGYPYYGWGYPYGGWGYDGWGYGGWGRGWHGGGHGGRHR
jgi:hypothetical protein